MIRQEWIKKSDHHHNHTTQTHSVEMRTKRAHAKETTLKNDCEELVKRMKQNHIRKFKISDLLLSRLCLATQKIAMRTNHTKSQATNEKKNLNLNFNATAATLCGTKV